MIKIAHIIGRAGDTAKSTEQTLRLRQLETYLSIFIALVRIIVFGVALYIAWQYTHPNTTSLTFIGASTVFFVLAGATLAPTLRDLTAGTLMIAEKWYNVGDYITIDPFSGESGIVERMNLRSTRIRKVTGEVIWIHNQHLQKVTVAPHGVVTIAIDIFVSDLKQSEKMVDQLKGIITVSPTMLAAPLQTTSTTKLADGLWQITVVGQVSPARQWLLEELAPSILKQYDEKFKKKKLLVYEPVPRFADEMAEKRFNRAVRINMARLVSGEEKPNSTAIAKGKEVMKKFSSYDRKKLKK